MKTNYRWIVLLALVTVLHCGGDSAYEEPAAAAEPETEATQEEAPAVDPEVVQMQSDCAAAADAIAARQVESSLYDRLGGREAIETVITDVIRLHRENPTITHLMEGVDDEHLIAQVTDFIAQGAGGDVEYHGKDMATAHENLGLTDEFFLSAGDDLQAAMEAAGVGEGEIEEVMCMFSSLHGDVVRS